MTHLPKGFDIMGINSEENMFSPEWGYIMRNISSPDYQTITFYRAVYPEDIRRITKQNLPVMPGFNLTWEYSGEVIAEQHKCYINSKASQSFVRKK